MMHKVAFLLMFFGVFSITQAQNIPPKQFHNPYPAYLSTDLFQWASSANWKLEYVKEDAYAKHYLFSQTHLGFVIENTQLKVDLNRDGHILQWLEQGVDIRGIQTKKLLPGSVSVLKNLSLFKLDTIWLWKPETLELAIKFIYITNQPFDVVECISGNDKIISKRSLLCYAHDTLCRGYAYNPDPLTSIGLSYGFPYYDQNDSTNLFLDAERIEVVFPCQDTNGYFYQRNKDVALADLDLPGGFPYVSTNGNFYFNRSEKAFEEANVMYHTYRFGKQWKDNGYDIMSPKLIIDPHALNGADNSFFSYVPFPQLRFGDGGVDDAEDADVIVHEMSHAMSYYSAPATNIGLERTSADEAYGDYFAASYSKRIKEFNWENIYSWDGHNEFWPGRFANQVKNYPQDLTSGIYNNGSLLCGAFTSLWNTLSQDTLDRLIMQSMSLQAKNTSLQDAAWYTVLSDSLLFNGKHACLLVNHFKNYGLIDSTHLLTCPTEFPALSAIDSIRFIVYGNIIGENTPYVYIPENLSPAKITLINEIGQIVYQSNIHSGWSILPFQNKNWSTGIYILEIRYEKTKRQFKLFKEN